MKLKKPPPNPPPNPPPKFEIENHEKSQKPKNPKKKNCKIQKKTKKNPPQKKIKKNFQKAIFWSFVWKISQNYFLHTFYRESTSNSGDFG